MKSLQGLAQPCPISTCRPRLLGGQDSFLPRGPSAQHRYQRREFPQSNWYTTKVKCAPPKRTISFCEKKEQKRSGKEESHICVYICTNSEWCGSGLCTMLTLVISEDRVGMRAVGRWLAFPLYTSVVLTCYSEYIYIMYIFYKFKYIL